MAALVGCAPPTENRGDMELVFASAEAKLPSRIGKVTSASLVRAAWGILTSRVTGATDVNFGLVVTGRNAILPNVEGNRRVLSQHPT